MTKTLIHRIELANARHGLFKKGDRIVVGVSGGPDSAALLKLLTILKRKYDLKLTAAHVHHGLGRPNDRLLKSASEAAASADVPFYLKRISVKKIAADTRRSLEEAGRAARYAFFAETAKKTRSAKIATAHTMDDQAETVLLRLFRGAGLSGLAGIPAKRSEGAYEVIRPLLDCRKDELLIFLKAARVPYCQDPSNKSRDFTRNKVRLKLIPSIEKTLGVPIKPLLAATARIAGDASSYMRSQAQKALTKASSGDALIVSRLSRLHPALKSALVRLAIERKRGHLRRLTHSHIDSVLSMAASAKPDLTLALPGLLVRKRSGKLHFVDTLRK